MEVGNYIVCGRHHGLTAISCPRQERQFRRSLVPHSEYDEKIFITALEGVRIISEEDRAMGAEDFFIGGDLNIQLKRRL